MANTRAKRPKGVDADRYLQELRLLPTWGKPRAESGSAFPTIFSARTESRNEKSNFVPKPDHPTEKVRLFVGCSLPETRKDEGDTKEAFVAVLISRRMEICGCPRNKSQAKPSDWSDLPAFAFDMQMVEKCCLGGIQITRRK